MPSEQVEAMTTALPLVQPTTKVVTQDLSQPKLTVGREIPHHVQPGRCTCPEHPEATDGGGGA